jgi:heat shock protein HtpX
VTILGILVLDAALLFVPIWLFSLLVLPDSLFTGPVIGFLVQYSVALPLLLLFQLWIGKRTTLHLVSARALSRDEYPALFAKLDRLAHQYGAPVPTVMLADSPVANALTVGYTRSPTIVVSEPLLDTLADEEVTAVLAHEFAHVQNSDVAIRTIAAFPALVATGVFETCSTTLERLDGGPSSVFTPSFSPNLVVIGLLSFATVVALWIRWIGLWLCRGLSRTREIEADRTAATVTGDPLALARALGRLDEQAASTPTEDLRRTGTLEPMSLLPGGLPDPHARTDNGSGMEIQAHPETTDRIERLRAMAAQNER